MYCYLASILIVWISLIATFKEDLVRRHTWLPYVASCIAVIGLVLTGLIQRLYEPYVYTLTVKTFCRHHHTVIPYHSHATNTRSATRLRQLHPFHHLHIPSPLRQHPLHHFSCSHNHLLFNRNICHHIPYRHQYVGEVIQRIRFLDRRQLVGLLFSLDERSGYPASVSRSQGMR